MTPLLQHAIKRREGKYGQLWSDILMCIVRAITEIARTDQRPQRPEYAKPPKLLYISWFFKSKIHLRKKASSSSCCLNYFGEISQKPLFFVVEMWQKNCSFCLSGKLSRHALIFYVKYPHILMYRLVCRRKTIVLWSYWPWKYLKLQLNLHKTKKKTPFLEAH